MIRNDATLSQIRAADPAGSTWLAANAGSGKTRVLTDRVARLLLQGVDPQQILCLTYTKAAASEMQNRLFKRLGAWAMADADTLRGAMFDLGEEQNLSEDDFARARTLFARAIETPGGLKIQTIHSFCSGLLRRFPLEAGVNPQFQEMEDRAAELLRSDIVDQMITDGARDLVDSVARHFSGESFAKLTGEIVRYQSILNQSRDWKAIAEKFGTSTQFGPDEEARLLFLGGEAELLKVLRKALLNGSKTDQAVGQKLAAIDELSIESLPILEASLLTQTGTPIKRNPTKAVWAELAMLEPQIRDFMDRIAAVRQARVAHSAARKTQALSEFATEFLTRYERAKLERGWLDFDDLILRTRALLSDSSVASWVLYRLDGGIRHILVDEAQDTSPVQWDVIRKLAEEFTSGQGVEEDSNRTIFVVGDKKQSIYSFQGADPDEFDRMEQEFAAKLRETDQPFASRSLEYSFRSSPAILELVDAVFEDQGQAGFAEQRHRAFHGDKPGRVDLWPVVPPAGKDEEREWYDPVDRMPPTHHTKVLAQQVADQIASMLDPADPAVLPEQEKDGSFSLRQIQAGDIMVLAQRRSALFHELIRACKQRDLPIAGADRLRVGAELAVRDLLGLLSFLATPEDSLSLATVLRSPLGGWSEKQLFDLAHDRKEPHLWETLRKARKDFPETTSMLFDLRNQIDFLRPYDLFERILTVHGGREKLLSRLGLEAEDGINALLSQALSYERSAIPSLTGFLSWARADELEIKRQVDSSGGLIRVMTVHGSKGLEAPVVILPDCGARQLTVKDELLNSDGQVIWKTSSNASPEIVTEAVEARKQSEARERQRLLYVALTRAESWLIVAAAGELSKDGSDWYSSVKRGIEARGAVPKDFFGAQGLHVSSGDWSGNVTTVPRVTEVKEEVLPEYFTSKLVNVPERASSLSPSELGGAKALPSPDALPEDIAKSRGTYVHLLLETLAGLPKEQRLAALNEIATPTDLTSELVGSARKTALDVLSNPKLGWVFGEQALAEVPLFATINGQTLSGTIDRLLIEKDKVIAIDFKSNAAVPRTPEQCPEAILRQMGAYAAMLGQIYPEKKVETGIVWTATSAYMALPQNLVSTALARSPSLDASAGPT